jgi:LysM repeat protein
VTALWRGHGLLLILMANRTTRTRRLTQPALRWSRRTAVGLIVVVLGVAPLTGCGEDELVARTTLAPIQPSSYVVRDPVVTSTTLAEDETQPVTLITSDGRSQVEQEYLIVAGDSVSAIANLYGITGEEIARYNDWPNGIFQSIFPGQVIRIPPLALVPGTTETPVVNEDGTPTQTSVAVAAEECLEGIYVLVAGDMPFRVAERFGVTLDALNFANRNTSGYGRFVVGTRVRIPCAE